MGRARHEYGRGRPTRTPRQTMLILCEGETEARYLTEACAGARLVSVLVRRAKWQTAIGILQEAERALGDRDEVWCVFDKDENELPAVMAAMERAAVHVAFSNPCFELWVLLHFEAWGRSLTTADAVRRVRRHMPEYAKGMGGLFAALLPGVSLALQRADDLRRMHEDAGRPICENPSTTVDALLAALEQADAAWRRK